MEQDMKKLWTSHEQVISIHEKVINKSWTIQEQVMNK